VYSCMGGFRLHLGGAASICRASGGLKALLRTTGEGFLTLLDMLLRTELDAGNQVLFLVAAPASPEVIVSARARFRLFLELVTEL
jgi:hypothetical protein